MPDKKTDRAGHFHKILHVVPVNDTREHEALLECWCCPQQDDENEDVYIHRSADGREDFEEGRRLPS